MASTAPDLGSLDKATPYAQGETMTLTIKTPKDERDVYVDEPFTVHIDVLGYSGDAAGSVHKNTGTWAPITLTDSSHVWTLQSDDGDTAVYTSTA